MAATASAAGLNKDGRADVLFHWKSTGTNRMYLSNALDGAGGAFSERLNPIGVTSINSTPNKVLVGNFDGGDAKSDLLFFWVVRD